MMSYDFRYISLILFLLLFSNSAGAAKGDGWEDNREQLSDGGIGPRENCKILEHYYDAAENCNVFKCDDGFIVKSTSCLPQSKSESIVDQPTRDAGNSSEGYTYADHTIDPNSDIAKAGRQLFFGGGTQVNHHPVVQIISDSKVMVMTPVEKKSWEQQQKLELEKDHKQIAENSVQNRKLLESLKTQTNFTREMTKIRERIDEKIRAFDNIEKRALLKVLQNWKSEDANLNMALIVSAIDQLINSIDSHNDHHQLAETSSGDYNLSSTHLTTSLKELIMAGQSIGSGLEFQVHMNRFKTAKEASAAILDSSTTGTRVSTDNSGPASLPAKLGAVATIAAVLCFTGDTPVCTSQRESKAIQEIRVGDVVQSCNLDLGLRVCESRKVQQVFKSTTNHLLNLSINGIVVRTTDNHPFYVIGESKWVEAKKLKKGDRLQTIRGHSVPVENIENEYGHFDVYNLEVEKHHNYYASGILVHNCTVGADAIFGAEIGAALGPLGFVTGGAIAGIAAVVGTAYESVSIIRDLSDSIDSRQARIDQAGRTYGAIEEARVYEQEKRKVFLKDVPSAIVKTVELETKVINRVGNGLLRAAPDSADKKTVTDGLEKLENTEKIVEKLANKVSEIRTKLNGGAKSIEGAQEINPASAGPSKPDHGFGLFNKEAIP